MPNTSLQNTLAPSSSNTFLLNPLGIVWVGLFAEDIEKLSAFYTSVVGLKLFEGDADYKIFDAGGNSLFEIWGKGCSKIKKNPTEQSMIIGFLVDDLEPVVQQLGLRGLAPDTEIKSYLGTRWVYFTDPEGNRFELKDNRG